MSSANHDLISSFLTGESDLDSDQLILLEASGAASPFLLMCKIRRNYLDTGHIEPRDWQRLRLLWNDTFELIQWKENGCQFSYSDIRIDKLDAIKPSSKIADIKRDYSLDEVMENVTYFIYETSENSNIESVPDAIETLHPFNHNFEFDFFIAEVPIIEQNTIQPKENNSPLPYLFLNERIITFIFDFDRLEKISTMDFYAVHQIVHKKSSEVNQSKTTLVSRHESTQMEENTETKLDPKNLNTDMHLEQVKMHAVEDIANIQEDYNPTDHDSIPEKTLSFTAWLRTLPGTKIVIEDSKESNIRKNDNTPVDKDPKKKKRKKYTAKSEETGINEAKKKKKKKAKKKKYKDDLERIIESSVEEQEDIISETLAMILHKQGHISKSIEMYEQLILLYPEKSSYFAARINELKKNK